jgi:hypothetical protein
MDHGSVLMPLNGVSIQTLHFNFFTMNHHRADVLPKNISKLSFLLKNVWSSTQFLLCTLSITCVSFYYFLSLLWLRWDHLYLHTLGVDFINQFTPYAWNLRTAPILFAQIFSNLAPCICALCSNYWIFSKLWVHSTIVPWPNFYKIGPKTKST